MKRVIGMLFFVGLAGCSEKGFEISTPAIDVQDAVRAYYMNKYPKFAKFQKDPRISITVSQSRDKCPVEECVNAWPDMCNTFVETTEESETTIRVTEVTPWVHGDKACRVVLSSSIRKKAEGVPYATTSPITEDEIRQWAKKKLPPPSIYRVGRTIGECNRAIVDLIEAIQRNPKDAEAYYYRGIAYDMKGEKAKSEADFALAEKLGFKPE